MLGHVPTLLGWFWVPVHNAAHVDVRPRSKKLGHKPKSTPKEIKL